MAQHAENDKASRFMLTMPLKPTLSITTGVILLALVGLYVDTYNMVPPSLPGYPGDAFFPRAVLIFSAVWASIILLRGLFLSQISATRSYEVSTIAVHWLEFISIIVLVLLYAELLEPLGFELMTTAFMLVLLTPRLMAVPGMTVRRALLQSLALSAGAMLILYAGLGPALKIGIPLKFLPIYLL